MLRLSHSAFILIELLIALALSALVMLTLAIGMNIIVTEWERSGNHLDKNLDKVLIILQIERALEGAYPHTYLNRDENKRYVFFEGEEEKLTWISTVSPGRKPGLTAWQLLPGKEKDTLEIHIISAFAGDPTKNLEETKPASTFEGYKAYFEYLYVDEKLKDEYKWVKEWSGQKRQGLPHAVRLRLENADESARSLEMIVTLRAHEHESLGTIKP